MSKSKPLLLKLCIVNFANASRNLRELSAAVEAGYEVKILAGVKLSPGENGNVDEENGFSIYRFDPFPNLELPYYKNARARKSFFVKIKKFFQNIIFTIRWAKKTRSFNADVISCHDLPALFIGYISNLFIRKSKKSKLVYDSHEFEIGRATSRSSILAFVITHAERFLIKRSVFSIMVNDSIADEVTRIHKLKTRPLVIRSTPINWDIDKSVCEKRRNEYIKSVNLPFEPFFVMYHGGIAKNRGIEQLIQVVSVNPFTVGIVLGFAQDNYLSELRNLADEFNVMDRILFLPAVPIDKIWEFVGAADSGLSLIQNTSRSYYLSLPNKFFELIQSLTPIIASDFPEMKKLVDLYNIGLTCDPTSVDEINKCVELIRTDKELFSKFKKNLFRAKDELCWDNEKTGLIEAYKNLE